LKLSQKKSIWQPALTMDFWELPVNSNFEAGKQR
jgi:hypothetical protein